MADSLIFHFLQDGGLQELPECFEVDDLMECKDLIKCSFESETEGPGLGSRLMIVRSEGGEAVVACYFGVNVTAGKEEENTAHKAIEPTRPGRPPQRFLMLWSCCREL